MNKHQLIRRNAMSCVPSFYELLCMKEELRRVLLHR